MARLEYSPVATGAPGIEPHWTHSAKDIIGTAYATASRIWFTVSPWRMRDLLDWATASDQRVRVGSALRLAFGLFVAALGLTVF